MKHLKSFSILLLFLSFTVYSSFALSTKNIQIIKTKHFEQSGTPKLENIKTSNELPLHNDVWFAFSAIGVLGAYIVFKK